MLIINQLNLIKMKNLLTIGMLLMTMFWVSCGNQSSSSNDEAKDSEAVEIENAVMDSEPAKDCDEFIDNYEKWMDDYLVLLEKYMKSPMDQELANNYMKLAQEATTWSQQWVNGFAMCAANEKYEKRFTEISEKAEKKLKELGLE